MNRWYKLQLISHLQTATTSFQWMLNTELIYWLCCFKHHLSEQLIRPHKFYAQNGKCKCMLCFTLHQFIKFLLKMSTESVNGYANAHKIMANLVIGYKVFSAINFLYHNLCEYLLFIFLHVHYFLLGQLLHMKMIQVIVEWMSHSNSIAHYKNFKQYQKLSDEWTLTVISLRSKMHCNECAEHT